MDMYVFLLFCIILIISIVNLNKTNRLLSEIKDLKNSLLKSSPNLNKEPFTEIPPIPNEVRADLSSPETNLEPEHEYPTKIGNIAVEPPVFIPFDEVVFEELEEDEENEEKEIRERRPRHIETFVGGNLLSKIGILALVIGIGFFVKYAVDNDWINEIGRTVLGLMTGLGIWAIAFRLRNSYRSFSSVLAGGGFAVCFVTIAIAHQYYDLFPGGIAFGIFILLSVMMIFLSLRFDRRELAFMAILGGYISPFLIINTNPNPVIFFTYISLLTIAIFIITMRRQWWELSVAGIILTWLATGLSITPAPTAAAQPVIIIGFTTLFFTLFSFPLAIEMESEKRNKMMFLCLILLTLLNPVAYLYLSLKAVGEILPFNLFKGFFPMYVSAVNLLILLYLKHKGITTILNSITLWITVVFAAIFIPVQFSSLSVRTLAFSIYALILTASFIITKEKFLLFSSVVVTFFTLAILIDIIFNDFSSHPSKMTLLCMGLCYVVISIIIDRKWELFQKVSNFLCHNYYGVTLYMGCAFIFFAAIGFIDRQFANPLASYIITIVGMTEILLISLFGRLNRYTYGFLPLAGIFLFFVQSFLTYDKATPAEIILHWIAALIFMVSLYVFARRVLTVKGIKNSKGFIIYYSLTGALFILLCILSALNNMGLDRYYSAGFSISLIISGTLLMFAGMYYRMVALRIESLIFFSILLIKLIAYDVWGLPVVGRIVVFILLGAVLLCISFLYQKLKDKLFSNNHNK